MLNFAMWIPATATSLRHAAPQLGAMSTPLLSEDWLTWLLAGAIGICCLALGMTILNLRLYGASTPKPCSDMARDPRPLAVCIPARDEEANIEACVRGVLALPDDHLRVLVYDDQSTDGTGKILQRLAAEDPRVIRVPTVPLPPGWNGKQHACWRMAEHALRTMVHQNPGANQPDNGGGADTTPPLWMIFTDADVRFEPGAGRAALTAADVLRADLVSTFPRQQMETVCERAVVPMIFFILFSYLPFLRMRRTLDPASSAGCGQFLCISARAYAGAGGHEAFKGSMHDGIMLPRSVRRAGFKSDLFDGTALLSCRMYRGARQVWRGFAKNAYEGLGSPVLLVFVTVMHGIGHLLPWVVVVIAAWTVARGADAGDIFAQARTSLNIGLAFFAIGVALSQRLLLARRLHLDAPVVLHPLGVLLMTLIQWHSFALHLMGRRSWKGRTLTPAGA